MKLSGAYLDTKVGPPAYADATQVAQAFVAAITAVGSGLLWLVSEAAWKERTRRIVGRPIELQRGQLVASLRFIASKWRWSEPRVRRFLAVLISEGMIDAKTDTGVTVITICKYDEYQRVSLPDRDSFGTTPGTAVGQSWDKQEDIKNTP